MKYLPDHGVFFVHIPKCAGMSIRAALQDGGGSDFAPIAADLGLDPAEAMRVTERSRGFEHPALGRIHPAHLPLALLQSHMPKTWDAMTACKPFAVTRNPRDRFISAVMQRMKEFKDAGAIRADDPEVAQEARAICDWLDARDVFADIEYIHFARQIDYVEIDGTRFVPNLFPLEQLTALEHWLETTADLRIEVTHGHIRRQPRKWARVVQPAARMLGRTLLPRPIKQALHPYWIGSAMFSNASQGYDTVDFGADVEAFIAQYYAPDAALHRAAQQAAGVA
ncbi:hypothetical protein [Roseobacter sp.]|uniref:hypothetical protein n=1 Tax=Roseobacter sp. TaxID=1907202 RepID=UPI0032978A89